MLLYCYDRRTSNIIGWLNSSVEIVRTYCFIRNDTESAVSSNRSPSTPCEIPCFWLDSEISVKRIKIFPSFIKTSEPLGRSLELNSKSYFRPLISIVFLKMACLAVVFRTLERFLLQIKTKTASYDEKFSDEELGLLKKKHDIKELKRVAAKDEQLEEPITLLEDSQKGDDDDEFMISQVFNKVLEEKKTSGFEILDEDIPRFKRRMVRVCDLLGLKLDFLDRLETFSTHHFHHRSLCEWITIFLQNNSRAISLAKKTCLTLELLDSIGFNPLSTAVGTIMTRSSKGHMQYHIEPSEWAEIYIQDEFNCNPGLSGRVLKFPLRSDLTNSWFQHPSNTDNEEGENDPNVNPGRVNIMNFVTTESNALKDLRSKLDGFLSQSDGATVLYHGTDHCSAHNILSRGINLTAGRLKRDFSCGTGFYLTKNLDEAMNWALSTTKKPAILVFQVNRKDLDSAKRLDLNNDEGRWREIVTSFRSGRRTANTRKSVSAYDLIEGPQATMSYDEASGELLWKRKSSSYQMCLISDDLAETFKKSLHSIFFLET